MTQMEIEQEQKARRRAVGGRSTNDATAFQTTQTESDALETRVSGSANGRARGLGWFSLGLGVAQLVAPGALSKLVTGSDSRRKRSVMRAIGVRELAAGLGILSRPRPTGFLSARVAGDIVDLALLGWSFGSKRNNGTNIALSAAAVLAITALDVRAARNVSMPAKVKKNPFDVQKSITINCSTDAAYRYWRNFQNLPSFMEYVEAVDVRDDRRSHWWAKAPGGKSFEWDAEVIEDRPTELIAWRTTEGAPVASSGEVRFAAVPGGRGTEVHFRMKYEAASNALARAVAKLFDKGVEIQMGQDLRRFKQIIELGEVVQSDASRHDGPHPARPSSNGGAR